MSSEISEMIHESVFALDYSGKVVVTTEKRQKAIF